MQLSNYVSAYIALAKAQIALMHGGIASVKKSIYIPTSGQGELDQLRSALGIDLTDTPLNSDTQSDTPGTSSEPPKTSSMFPNSDEAARPKSGVSTEPPGESPNSQEALIFLNEELNASNFPIIVPIDQHATTQIPLSNRSFKSLRPYLIEVPVDLIPRHKPLEDLLKLFHSNLCRKLKSQNKSQEVYWSIGTRDQNKTICSSIDLQFDVEYAIDVQIPETLSPFFKEFVGMDVSIEIGMASVLISDRWAGNNHANVRPGMLASADDGSFTVTAIVRPISDVEPLTQKRYALTVGHGILPGFLKSNNTTSLAPVHAYQPASSRNADRIVGRVFGGCYRPIHNSIIDYDVGLIELNAGKAGANSFGREGFVISGLAARPIDGDHATFYGGMSGSKDVIVRRLNVAAEVKGRDLDGNAIRVYMSDLIEVVDRTDRSLAIATEGDSGAPLVVKQDSGNYLLVGYIVAAGQRRGTKRHPRTYVHPADVVFDALSIKLA